jgi:hypothetical protein
MRKFAVVRRGKIPRVVVAAFLCMQLIGCGASMQITQGPPSAPVTLSFAAPVSFPSVITNPDSIAVADFNRDGKMDFAVVGGSNQVEVYLNSGNGIFGAPKIVNVQNVTGVSDITVGDLNEDGKPDLIAATSLGTVVLFGNGDGTFAQQNPLADSVAFTRALAVDLNHDGHLDLVQGSEASVTAMLGKGDGTFGAAVTTPPTEVNGEFWGMVVGDFNGDGKLDVVLADAVDQIGQNQTATLLFFAGNGDGTFQSAAFENISALFLNTIAGGDFNGDGKQDLVIGTLGTAFLAVGKGDGTFPSSTASMPEVGALSASSTDFRMRLATADFDLDGRPDVVIGGVLDGQVQLSLNSAQGFLSAPTGKVFNFTLDPGFKTVAAADFNGDGLPDILVCNQVTNQISIILSVKQ